MSVKVRERSLSSARMGWREEGNRRQETEREQNALMTSSRGLSGAPEEKRFVRSASYRQRHAESNGPRGKEGEERARRVALQDGAASRPVSAIALLACQSTARRVTAQFFHQQKSCVADATQMSAEGPPLMARRSAGSGGRCTHGSVFPLGGEGPTAEWAKYLQGVQALYILSC